MSSPTDTNQASEDDEIRQHCDSLGVPSLWYDRLIEIVAADRKKHELQARIDELNSLPHRSVTALTSSVDQSVIYERLDELKQELEKL